ncbi:MAG: helix-turn-helix transcriptional regulator [Pirellulaceae bacterium]|jgi:transcriptional regulator with XRE-family HTH domain|nr:helix-turn-helix transcriptional regulator [Pirellulaceae bacterium]
MATAELSVVHLDDAPVRPLQRAQEPGHALHRIQEVRRLQGMSLRTASRQLGMDVRAIRAQEQSSTDLRLSDLYKWQSALEVPIADLLVDDEAPLSRGIRERAQLVKMMKTARALSETASCDASRRMAENLIEQLLELMPELREVGAWHSVGQRRGLDELGRIAERPISDLGMGGCDSDE